MLKALTALAIVAASSASACDTYVAHIASYHTDRDAITNVNEVNPGLGCRFDNGVEVGVYKNSYHKTTAYAIWDSASEGLGVFAGVASGYQDDRYVPNHGITPVAGVAYHTESTTIRAMPTFTAKGDAGMVLAFSFVFGG